ncbi:MAG TPA: hypothetical protein VFG20_23510 [Planctomycetaceae bacterium]|nr:hypothetical protein [Planctomycetaceae bacterium]
MGLARVVVLMLTVWLFAAAWSNDRPVDLHGEEGPGAVPKATSAVDLGPLVQHGGPSFGATRFASIHLPPAGMANWLTALPLGVTPGTYLVVHPQGFTERVTIDAEFLQTLGHDPDVTPQATHTVQIDGQTLTLVRITMPASRIVIAEGPMATRRF